MKFISKYKEHRVGLVPARHLIDNFGRRNYQAGVSAQFHNGEFETNDPQIIKFLKESVWYGVDFKGIGDNTPQTEVAKETAKAESESVAATLTSCPFCIFNAKTPFGLRSHIRLAHKTKAD